MAAGDLTSLSNVKSWLQIESTDNDALLSRLISAASQFTKQWLSRDIIEKSYSQRFSGMDNVILMLPQYPVVSVSAVSINNVTIPYTAISGNTGFTYDDMTIQLYGYVFTRGLLNVSVSYTAGFRIADEPAVVERYGTTPSYTYEVRSLANFWLEDLGVKDANGATMVRVSSNPTSGQYTVSDGVYTFNSAQNGATVYISYKDVPMDISEAVCMMIGERFRLQDRIGVVSKGLAGETVTFSQKDMSSTVRSSLMPYRKVMPV